MVELQCLMQECAYKHVNVKCSYDNDGVCFWSDWRCAAMAHYSFFYRLEQNTLDAYSFPLWDLSYPKYRHWSINMFAFNTNTILGAMNDTTEISDEANHCGICQEMHHACCKR